MRLRNRETLIVLAATAIPYVTAIVVLMALVHGAILLWVFGYTFDMGIAITAVDGALFVVLGAPDDARQGERALQ